MGLVSLPLAHLHQKRVTHLLSRNYPPHRSKSEFTVVATEFYNSLRNYLSSLTNNPNKIYSLEDVVAWNRTHTEHEGGIPGTHPAWPTGQDTFEMALELKGEENADYVAALGFIHRKSREEGIDAALGVGGGKLDGILVPVHAAGAVACQIAAKAGRSLLNFIAPQAKKYASTDVNDLGYPMISIPVGVNELGLCTEHILQIRVFLHRPHILCLFACVHSLNEGGHQY